MRDEIFEARETAGVAARGVVTVHAAAAAVAALRVPVKGEGVSMTGRPNSEQWLRVKQRLRTELGEDVFNSWFARVEFEEADATSVTHSVPTRFLKSWIASHYG